MVVRTRDRFLMGAVLFFRTPLLNADFSSPRQILWVGTHRAWKSHMYYS